MITCEEATKIRDRGFTCTRGEMVSLLIHLKHCNKCLSEIAEGAKKCEEENSPEVCKAIEDMANSDFDEMEKDPEFIDTLRKGTQQ